MNKFSQAIHKQFVAGHINSPIFNYMLKIASSIDTEQDISLFDQHIKKLAELHVQSIDDCEHYFSIHAQLPQYTTQLIKSSELNTIVFNYAFLNRNKYDLTKSHNYSRLVLDFIKDNADLVKNSHPNNAGIESSMEVDKPFNIDKWIEAMRYIYNVANTNNLSLDSVTNQVVADWPENEQIHFQRWMRYYQEGNYSKYNVKTAQLFSTRQEAKIPDVKDMFQPPSMPNADPMVEKKQKLDEARTKLRSRLISIEQLVERYREVLPKDISALIRQDVYELKERIYGLELKASVVDSIIRASNQFTKRGFIEGAKELKKIAQEVAEDRLPAAPAEPLAEPQMVKQDVAEPIQKEPEVVVDTQQIRVPEVNVGEEAIEMPDFNSATHRDALQKLEEINKVISERNVVRALAAVDIILGQLGIASYFPQLSEAQSKMMDAFNYAGSRVAETIGQMRGGSRGGTPPVEKQPKQDVVEVADETEKPVGEVISGGPQGIPAQAPKV